MKLALVAMMFAMACTKAAPPVADTTPTPTTTTTAAEATGPRVIFPDGFVVRVELATDDETRAQGLMYRDHLKPGTGMLFIFPRDGEYGFWMKNTLIPLDMIWIDSQQRVSAVRFNVPPCQIEDCPSYPPGAPARYVLEVAGGVAQQHGIKPGDQLRFVQTDGVEIR